MERITTIETLWDVLGKVYNAVYRLQEIENILGDNYDLERLKELGSGQRRKMRSTTMQSRKYGICAAL